MQIDSKRLSNLMLVTLLILLGSATLGVFIASMFFTGAAAMSALALGPFALITTLPAALAFASLVNLLVLVVPFWGLIGGCWFAIRANSQFKSANNPLGVTFFSDTHPIHIRLNELARDLDLPTIKWVGWFDDHSINAFAMSLTRDDALVAFSKGAIEKLSREELNAVMGHELAHVANHDMQRMTLAYGVQRSLTWFLIFRKLKAFARWVFTPISELEIMRFSRQREYWADAIGAVLTSPDAMAGALQKIEQDQDKPAQQPKELSRFMFQSSAHSFFDRHPTIFDTHPSISSRVKALEKASYIGRLPMKEVQEETLLAAE